MLAEAYFQGAAYLQGMMAKRMEFGFRASPGCWWVVNVCQYFLLLGIGAGIKFL